MSFGISVTTDNGDLQVSDSYPTLHFIGRATLVTAASSSGTNSTGKRYYPSTWRITGYAGITPLPFVRTASGVPASINGVVWNGSAWDITVWGFSVTEVLVFSKLPAMGPAETFGLQVLNESGVPMFDSTRKPLWVRHLVPNAPSLFNTIGTGRAITLPSGIASPAFFLSAAGGVQFMSYDTHYDYWHCRVPAATVSGTTMSVSWFETYYRETYHSEVRDIVPEPTYTEDGMSPGLIAVIDSSLY